MPINTSTIVLGAICLALVMIILVLIFTRARLSGQSTSAAASAQAAALAAELQAIREAKSSVERQLAVETERSSRIPGLESGLSEKIAQFDLLVQQKASAESRLAANTEALSRVEVVVQDLNERLKLAEQLRDDLRTQLDSSRAEKSSLDESLAAKTEAVSRLEVALAELRKRLQEAEQSGAQLSSRVEVLVQERGDLEGKIAEKSAQLNAEIEAAAKLGERLERSTSALEVAQREVLDLRTRLAAVQETLEQERKQADERLALLADAKDRMTQEFKLLASDVMQSHGETFSKQNKEQIETILTPLREKLGEFQQGIQLAHTESTKERATLAEQIRQLTESSAKMTTETANLTRALKGEAQTQGAWGEMILASILQRSGLREGEEYLIQQSHATEEGSKVRPDVVVNLPGGQRIVIDSKLSLTAFDSHVNAMTVEERAEALVRHLASMRGHIKTLASKEYHAVVEGQIDYVIMFVPIEGALAAALQGDPNLTAFAVENSVAIATPTTLMIALRTVANVWQVERRNRNAEQIAVRAGRLYDKLVGFVEDMNALGNRLHQARVTYDEAMGKLSSGTGNVLRQVEQLKVLGARTNKSLPTSLLDDGEVEVLPLPDETKVV